MILIYHVVSDDSPYLYSISRSAMEQHFQLLAEPPRRFCREGEPCVTFDDGHISQYECALPLLERCGLRATFFITPEWTDKNPRSMGWAQLRELVRLGHQVESHGWSHKFLTQCSATELQTELLRSKNVLEDGLGVPVEALAVPNGAWNQRVLLACVAAGYRRVYTSDPFVRRVEKTGLEVFGRFSVKRTMRPSTLEQLARAEHSAFSGVRIRHRAKYAVRAALGQRLYHRLWCWWAQIDSQDGSSRSYQSAPTTPI
jgi:peptidoglycan/xylan/chitin deacetylase (PgdA/CDA1 family)